MFVIFFLFRSMWRCCCQNDKVDASDMTIIEGLPHFFSVLKNKDREFWFREEVVARERLGLQRTDKKNFEELVLAERKTSKGRLRSVHNYDILANPIYSDRFLYIPCVYPQRSDYTMSEYQDPYMKTYSTDLVRLVCDLAYLPVSVGRELKFNEEFIFRRMCEKRN